MTDDKAAGSATLSISRRLVLRRGLASAFVLLLITLLFAAPVSAVDIWDGNIASSFGGGTGADTDPYLISTGAQLAYLAQEVNNGTNYLGNYFKLMDDIDLNGTNHQWIPIGSIPSDQKPFRGTFDGNNKNISNMNISSNSNMGVCGLFGLLTKSSVVKNLNVAGCINMDSSRTGAVTIGGVAGRLLNGGTVENCSSDVDINVKHQGSSNQGPNVGGIVGYIQNGGTVVNCYATGDVSGTVKDKSGYARVGGIVGCAHQYSAINISNCYAAGNVSASGSTSGKNYVGGIVGYGDNMLNVSNCCLLYTSPSPRD